MQNKSTILTTFGAINVECSVEDLASMLRETGAVMIPEIGYIPEKSITAIVAGHAKPRSIQVPNTPFPGGMQ